MDEDRIRGTVVQAEGSVNQVIGTVTGDAALEADGTAQVSAGRARKILGLAKNKSRAASKGHE